MVLPWVPTVLVGERVPDDPRLTDQRGHSLRWSQLNGTAFAVTFIYTRCKEANECPATSAKFEDLQHELPAHAHLLEVTLDPVYDTPQVLERYGAMFDADSARWSLATGDPVTVLTLAERFGVEVSPGRVAGQLEHGEALAIFDTQERLVSLTAGNTWQPREVLAELQHASGQRSSFLDRLTLWFQNFGAACGALPNALSGSSRAFAFATAAAMLAVVFGSSISLLRGIRAPRVR